MIYERNTRTYRRIIVSTKTEFSPKLMYNVLVVANMIYQLSSNTTKPYIFRSSPFGPLVIGLIRRRRANTGITNC